jgi:hypothetical protein
MNHELILYRREFCRQDAMDAGMAIFHQTERSVSHEGKWL